MHELHALDREKLIVKRDSPNKWEPKAGLERKELPEAPPPKAPEKRPMALKLEEIRGTVEVRRGGGQWRTASVGEALHPSDAVRTREGAYAVIIGG